MLLVWGAACHEKMQEGMSQSCPASPVLAGQTCICHCSWFYFRLQGSTLSNCPESLGTTDVPITRSSEASLWTANLTPDVPTPTASQTNHSQVSHQKRFCNYTALLNRCLLVTRFLFPAHLFLCNLTPSLLMLWLPLPEEKQQFASGLSKNLQNFCIRIEIDNFQKF